MDKYYWGAGGGGVRGFGLKFPFPVFQVLKITDFLTCTPGFFSLAVKIVFFLLITLKKIL